MLSYSAPVFFFFLIFLVILFYSIPVRLRALFLFLSSFVWMCSWNVDRTLILYGILSFNILILMFAQKVDLKYFRQFLYLLIGCNTFCFLSLKVGVFSSTVDFANGLSFFYMAVIGYLIDCLRKSGSNAALPGGLFSASFFPALMGGPILRTDTMSQFSRLTETFRSDNVINGTLLFFLGFFKYNLLASKTFLLADAVRLYASENFVYFIFSGILYTFAAYIEFSSYCDMGRGAARCFGLNLPINFRAFYYAKTPIDLWSRWNISLGEWIRDYISFPLMLRLGRRINSSFFILFSFILVGLWHDISWNWLCFGIFNGLCIVIYSSFVLPMQNKNFFISAASARILVYTMFVVNGFLANYYSLKTSDALILSSFKHMIASEMPYFFFFSILLIVEFFQERFKETDFYFSWHKYVKLLILMGFLAAFLLQLDRELYLNTSATTPHYFNF